MLSFSLFSDQNFNTNSYIFNSNKTLKRNEWIQIIIAHSKQNFRIFINGVPEFSLEEMSHFVDTSLCREISGKKNGKIFSRK